MEGRRILLIVGGGIAAIKIPELIRLMKKDGLSVTPVLTRAGAEFVTPLSLSALAEAPCHQELFDLTRESEMGHIQLSRAADLVVVAPATANLMARMASGLADDLATTLLLATDKPVLIAPAMNVRMWGHAATTRNRGQLARDGIRFVGPDEGVMACGEFGEGRMAEPATILAAIQAQFQAEPPFRLSPAAAIADPVQSRLPELAADLGGIDMAADAPLPLGQPLAADKADAHPEQSAGATQTSLGGWGDAPPVRPEADHPEPEDLGQGDAESDLFQTDRPGLDDPAIDGASDTSAMAETVSPVKGHVPWTEIPAPSESGRSFAGGRFSGAGASDLDAPEAPLHLGSPLGLEAPLSLDEPLPHNAPLTLSTPLDPATEAAPEPLADDAAPGPLHGRHIIVTSGPTHEPIDPVRYIANRSSGAQGAAIAAALVALGARISFVTGPAQVPAPAGVTVIAVETALQMRDAVEAAMPADAAVMAAAVADWRVANASGEKIKKNASGSLPALELVENPDILAWISRLPQDRPRLVVGFAAETSNILQHATEKWMRKGCDWIVANDVSPETGIMGGSENAVTLISRRGPEKWPRLTKAEVARRLAARIADALDDGVA